MINPYTYNFVLLVYTFTLDLTRESFPAFSAIIGALAIPRSSTMEDPAYIYGFAQAVHPAWNASLALLCLANFALSAKTQISYHSSKEMRSRKYHRNYQAGEREYYVHMYVNKK